MTPAATQSLVEHIIKSTNNDVILFMIVIFIILLMVVIPMYRMAIRRRRDESECDINEKKLMIDVVKENTSAITSLKTTLDINNTTMVELLQGIQRDTSNTNVNITRIITNQENTIRTLNEALEENTKTNEYVKSERLDLSKISVLVNQLSILNQTTAQTHENIKEVITLSNDIVNKLNMLADNDTEENNEIILETASDVVDVPTVQEDVPEAPKKASRSRKVKDVPTPTPKTKRTKKVADESPEVAPRTRRKKTT